MSISPYTQKRTAQDRGPQQSDDYNARVEENYRDLMYLYNHSATLRNDMEGSFSAVFKQLLSITTQINQFDTRLDALEAGGNTLVFSSYEQIDTDRFNSANGGTYNVPAVDRLSYQKNYNALTLPYLSDSSLSKLRFTNDDGTYNVANGLEVLVVPVAASADAGTAVVETSSPYDAILGRTGRVWERNVLANATHANGAQCYMYVRIPNELSITGTANSISFTPFPVFDVDVMEIAYATDPHISLTSTTGWTMMNEDDWYINNNEAVGHIPPGAWTGDAILNSGPKLFYFEPEPITAIRFMLRQNSYYTRGTQYLYTYGLADLDVRYDKFLGTGKTIIRLDAPSGDVINNITSVSPKVWNVAQSNLNAVFDYRVIWETAFNSGSYTLTPVSASQRVWLEITLHEVSPGYTPSLTSVLVNYT